MAKQNLKDLNDKRKLYQVSLNEYINNNPALDKSRSNTAAVLNAAGKSVADQARAIWTNASPNAAQKLKQYQAYQAAGGQGLSAEATQQLFSKGFVMPKTLRAQEYDYEASKQARKDLGVLQIGADIAGGYDAVESAQNYVDQLAFIAMHRNEGNWDVKGNAAKVLSDKFLKERIAALGGEIEDSKQRDAEWDATKDQKMADYYAAMSKAGQWSDLYKDRMRGYEDPEGWSKIPNGQRWGQELAAQEYNWLLAKYLQGNYDMEFQDFYTSEQKRWEGLTNDEYDAEMDALDQMFQGLDWESLMHPETPVYNSATDKLTKQLAEYEAEEKYRNNMAYYRNIADSTAGTTDLEKYYAENIEGYDPKWYNPEYFANQTYYINNPPTANITNTINRLTDDAWEIIVQSFTGELLDEEARVVREYFDKGYDLLMPEEVAIYNDLLNTDPMMAQVFLYNMSDQLRERRIEYNALETQLMAEDPLMGAVMSIVSVADQLPATIYGVAGALRGEDANSTYYDLTRNVQTVRSTRANEWKKALPVELFGQEGGATLYNVIMSGLDMLYAKKVGGMLGAGNTKAAQAAMQTIMSSEVMASTIYDDLQKGYTNEQATLHGVANGIIEAIMEKGFMDELFGTGKTFSTKVLKSMLAEGGEELGSELFQTAGNEFMAFLTGKESEIQQAYEYFKNNAVYGQDPGAMTLQYYANQFALAGLSGMAMGGGVAAVTSAGEVVDNIGRGKMVKQSGDVQRTMEIALGMDEKTDTAQIAKQLKVKQDKGKQLTAYDLGRLTAALEADTSTQLAEAPNKVMEQAIEDRLMELGEDGKNAKALAPVIRKVYRGQSVSKAEMKAVSWDDNAEQVVKELTRETSEEDAGRVGVDWANEAKARGVEETAKVMETAVDRGKAVGQIRMPEKKESTTVEQAVDKVVKESAAKVTVTKGSKVPATTATKVAVDDGTGVVDGNASKFVEQEGEVKLEVKTDSGTKAVSPGMVKRADGSGIAAIAAWVEASNNGAAGTHQMSAQEASTMLQVYQTEGGDAGNYIKEFERAYLDGYSGAVKGKYGISEQAAAIAYEQGKVEAAGDETNRVEYARKLRKAAKGTVAWLGEVTSNEEVTGDGNVNELEDAKRHMTEGQRTTVEVLEAIAYEMKVDMVLFSSAAGSISNIQNGSYNRATGMLYLDINAGAYTTEQLQQLRSEDMLGYAQVKVAGHEVTHLLEANSPEAYAKYKTAVKQELKREGQDWATLVRSKIEAARMEGRKMTYAGAEAEVVADASEYMLQNSRFVQNLESNARSKVKQIVQNFMQKLQQVFSKLLKGNRESDALRKSIDGVMQYTGDLQKLWDAALDEALMKQTEEQAAEDIAEAVEEIQPTTQFQGRSNVEVRTDGLMAVHNLKEGDMEATLDLGGFPMPSIAIIKAKEGHTMYGEYSAIFDKSTIDPKASVKNRVYGADACTPVFPTVETEILDDELYEVEQELHGLAEQVDKEYGQKARGWFGNYSGLQSTTKTMSDVQDSAWNNAGIVAAYMTDHGKEVQILEKDVPVQRGYSVARADMYNKILDIIDVMDLVNMKKDAMLNKYGDQLAEAIPRPFAVQNAEWKNGDLGAGVRMLKAIEQAVAYEGAGRDVSEKTEKAKDLYATEDAMRNSIDRADFNEWIREKMQGVFGEKGIYNGLDRYTPSGNRRTFKQLHMPVTAQNVVKNMAAEPESKIYTTDAKGLMAAAARMYKSIAEIKADAGRLKKVDELEYRALITAADNLYHDLLNEIEAWDYNQIEEVGELLVQAAKKRMDAPAIAAMLKRADYDAGAKAGKMAAELIDRVQSIPSGYFEAKPARVVEFSEIKMIIAPDTMPAKLAQRLEEMGIPYTTYDGTDADRIAKANAVEDVQFSGRGGQILNNQEYARLQHEWNNYIYRGYQYVQRSNGGILVDFDNALVYTDGDGEPEYVLDVIDTDREINNDIIQMAMKLERKGVDHETQRSVLESVYGEGSARFRSGKERKGAGRKKRTGAGRAAREMGQGNYGQVPEQEKDVTQYSTRKYEDVLTIREYLGEMKPTARMNETEKILLKRYQEQLKELKAKEAMVAEQEAIIKAADVTSEELTKAKNRREIYRNQANRAARALNEAERENGFARLMATSEAVVNQYLLGSAGNVADAADALETEVAGLTKQLKAVEADITRTASAQRTAFARGLFDQKTLNDAAAHLKNTYGSRMSVKTIADRLALVYGEIYANDGAEGAMRFAQEAKDLAADILVGHKFRYKSDILPMLQEKIGTISLSETDLQEIRNAGMTVSEYKHGIGPWVKVAEGASDLSSYASNAIYYGDGALAAVLGEEAEGNLAMNLYNTIQQEKAQEQEIGVEDMSEGEMITAVMADIAGSNMPLSMNSKTTEYLRNELKKFAGESAIAAQNVEQTIMNAQKASSKATDVWRAAVKEVNTAKQAVEYYRKLEDQRRLTELADLKKAVTEELKSDAAQKLAEKLKEQREEQRTREQKARMYRHTRDEVDKLRRKVGRDVKRLNTLRVRETDQKHVPQEFQHVADAVMRTFTDSALSKLAFSAEKTASLQRTYRILEQLENDVTHFWDDEMEAAIDNLVYLSEAYNALRNREGNAPSYMSLEGVKLEVEILQGVDNIVSNVLHMIDTANKNFLEGRKQTFERFAEKAGEKLSGRENHKVLKGKAGEIQTMVDETLRLGNMTPVYYFEHLQNDELMQVFNEIRKAQSKYAKIVAEGKVFIEETKARYHYGAWVADGKLKMKTSNGHNIELTREEAAELYAVHKREQANKLYQTEHLIKGGFQYKNIADKGEGKVRDTDKPHQLDAADMARIGEWLTEEQKAYADALVGYLSSDMADYGNAASMAMYGYKKFTESYYIPFKTVADQRFQRGDEGPQGDNAGTGRLKNAGFTNKVQNKANATLYIGGLTDTVADHIHKMAAYASMVKPIEDMKRLLNFKVVEADGTVNTIRHLIGIKYGKASEDYMNQLLKDLNGATQSDNRASKLPDKLVSAYKRGAVLASASVALQQPTAIARAMAYISPKYFAQNPAYRPSKGTWDEMMKYAGTAVIKDMGKFDVGMGLTATQYMSDEQLGVFETYRRLKADSKTKAGKAAFDRFMEKATALPGLMDQWTWGLIWKAVKAEQAAQHPGMDVNSDAFLEMCGRRFDDVIDRTQVYDSVLTRSNLMRSTNWLHKSATAFMSEPTLSLNMLYNALTGKYGAGKRAAIIGSVVASQVLAGAMAALAQAWNDDEDKRNWAEKYTDRATANIMDNLNPLSMIPYVSDIVSLLQGYDVERPDTTVLADIINYTEKFIKSFEDGGAPTWKEVENFAGTWANLLGVPAKNMSREIRRLRNAIMNTDWSTPSAFGVKQSVLENLIGYDSKKTAYYERIVAADLNGDTQLAQDYREFMLASKATSEDALKEGLKKAMKERYIRGDADEDTAIQYLLKIGAYTEEDDAYWEVDKWEYMQETGNGADSYRKYNAFFQAVETGKDLKAVIKEYTDNGVSKTTLATQITNQYKQQLIDLKKSGKGYADLQARILTAYEALGYDREKKLKDIQKWFEK